MANGPQSQEPPAPPAGRWIARALGLAEGVTLHVPPGGALSWRDGTTPRTRFLEVAVRAGPEGCDIPALLRVVPYEGRAGGLTREALAAERDEHRRARGEGAWLAPPPVPLDPSEELDVLPPLLFCREKKVLIAAVGPAGDEPLAVLAGLVGESTSGTPPGDAVPCVACDRRSRCFPPGVDPAKGLPAAHVTTVVSAHPWGGLLTESPELDWGSWLAVASGSPWSAAPGSRPLATGPEHGPSFAVETLLVRLDFLRQALEALGDLHERTGHPHLDLRPEGFAFRLGDPHPWSPLLWTLRLRLLESGPGRVAAESSEDGGGYRPPEGRPAELVPAACGSGGWVEGRCLPGGGPEPWTLPRWDLKFLPGKPDRTPERGAVVGFELSAGRGSAAVRGRIAVAFQEVWSVQVESPAEQRAAIEELLGSDQGHPMIRMREIVDHSLEDDLFALGTIWLAILLDDGASLEQAVALRDALSSAGPTTGAKGLEAVARGAAPLRYHSGDGEDDGRLPAPLLEAALEIGRRLTGGDPGGLPGEGHEPTTAEERKVALRGLAEEAADLARIARECLFGASADDAEIRAALERIEATGG